MRFTLEPEVLGEAKLGYDEVLSPEKFEPHFGIDESGKGDFFGPLVIAGVYVDAGIARHLIDAGVQDSKRIGSDAKIRALASIIRALPGAAHSVVAIGPERVQRASAKDAQRQQPARLGACARHRKPARTAAGLPAFAQRPIRESGDHQALVARKGTTHPARSADQGRERSCRCRGFNPCARTVYRLAGEHRPAARGDSSARRFGCGQSRGARVDPPGISGPCCAALPRRIFAPRANLLLRSSGCSSRMIRGRRIDPRDCRKLSAGRGVARKERGASRGIQPSPTRAKY